MSDHAAGTPKPDFSGDYVLNRQASTLSPGGADLIRTGRIHIEHREPNLHCHFTYIFDDDNRFEGTFDLITDGRKSQVLEGGHSTVMTLRWDGDALVFTGRSKGILTFRYELIDDGFRLCLTEQNRGMEKDQDNILVFDRQ